MQLYEKITSSAGRVTYREYKPIAAVLPDMEIEVEEVVSILGTLVVSVSKAMEEQLSPSDILCRKIRNLNRELIELVRVGFVKPRPVMVDIGVDAWNAAVKTIQDALLRGRLC